MSDLRERESIDKRADFLKVLLSLKKGRIRRETNGRGREKANVRYLDQPK